MSGETRRGLALLMVTGMSRRGVVEAVVGHDFFCQLCICTKELKTCKPKCTATHRPGKDKISMAAAKGKENARMVVEVQPPPTPDTLNRHQ